MIKNDDKQVGSHTKSASSSPTGLVIHEDSSVSSPCSSYSSFLSLSSCSSTNNSTTTTTDLSNRSPSPGEKKKIH